jgi:hypothetical protein
VPLLVDVSCEHRLAIVVGDLRSERLHRPAARQELAAFELMNATPCSVSTTES